MINKFPYTNFHELNLDWIISKIKEYDSVISSKLSDDNLTAIISELLEQHPEWISTVVDGSISYQKLDADLKAVYDEIIDYLNNNVVITFLSNEGVSGITDDNFTGLSALIQTPNKTGIYDFGSDVNQGALMKALNERNINKIDFAIISHYHSDHIGGNNGTGLNYLLTASGLDFDGCIFYLPHGLIDWGQFTGTNYQSVETLIKNMLTNAGITYVEPVENQTINIDNINIKFNNLSVNKFNQYYPILLNGSNYYPGNNTSYNNFTMIVQIEYLNQTVLLTGDIEEKAEELNADILSNNINIYQVEHHGLNLRTAYNFIERLAPKVTVISGLHTNGYYSANGLNSLGVIKSYDSGATVYNTLTNGNISVKLNGNNPIVTADIADLQNIPNASRYNYNGQIIPLNTDLDDIITPGNYWSPNAEYTAQLVNVPASVAGFTLLVESTTGNSIAESLRQILIPSSSSLERIYIRGYSAGSYLPWGVIGLLPTDNNANAFSTVTEVGITVSAGGFVEAGNICFVDIKCTANGNISATAFSGVASGLPQPLKGNYPILNVMNQTDRTMVTKAGVTADGRLAINNVASGNSLDITGCYLCKI